MSILTILFIHPKIFNLVALTLFLFSCRSFLLFPTCFSLFASLLFSSLLFSSLLFSSLLFSSHLFSSHLISSFLFTYLIFFLNAPGGWIKPVFGGIEDWGKQIGRNDFDPHRHTQDRILDPLLNREQLIVSPREDATSK